MSEVLYISVKRFYRPYALPVQHTHSHFTALWILSGKTWVSRYQKKHSPTHTCRGHQSSLICFLHPLRSTASSLFSLHAWQSFSTICVQVFFGLPLGLVPSTSYFIHFFTQSLSSFCSTCPYYCNLFCCSTEIMSFPNLEALCSTLEGWQKSELNLLYVLLPNQHCESTKGNVVHWLKPEKITHWIWSFSCTECPSYIFCAGDIIDHGTV